MKLFVIIQSDIYSLLIGIFVIFAIMWILGKAFEADLKDLEKTNPKYRKFLKDKYGM